MTIENPVWGSSDTGLVHVTEAPPPGYPFYPKAACGETIVGDRLKKGDFPKGTEFCATCEKATGTGEVKKESDK